MEMQLGNSRAAALGEREKEEKKKKKKKMYIKTGRISVDLSTFELVEFTLSVSPF